MVRRRGPPSQGWKTFLRNHANGIAAMDLFVVPTVSFRLLYGLLIMGHGRRQILWLGVTAHPTAEWIANQLTAACGWEQLPRYLIRDRDACYGDIFVRRVRSLGIRDHPTSARLPWQNGYAERLIGSIRRECLDHIVVIGEQHLRHILMCYMEYYNAVPTHLSLAKDAPVRRLIQRTGRIQVRARSWRAAPSIRTDLIFGRDRTYASALGIVAELFRAGQPRHGHHFLVHITLRRFGPDAATSQLRC
jgi:transposase InsO family protein